MTVFKFIVAMALCLLAAPAAAQAKKAPKKAPACGATIKTDTKLRADLAGCPGDGLVIGADNVTLDLGRRTVSGSGAGVGIRLAGRRGVTIKGGTIRGFATGIVLDGADRNRLKGVAVSGSAGRAIDLLNGSDGNRIERISSSGNRTGIAITASSHNAVVGSRFTDNLITGVLLFGASGTTVHGNRISGSLGNGIAIVEGSTGNRATANRVEGAETGLIIDTSDRNTLAFNRVSGSGDGILVAGDRNAVLSNTVDGAVGCEDCAGGHGIGILGGAGNTVAANFVQRSLADGINVAAPGTWIARNAAHRNGGFGINAVAGVRDGGRNVALHNGNPAQCAGVACGPKKSKSRRRGR